MSNVAAFWAAVKREASGISEPFAYLMSLDDVSRGMVGGVVCHVSREKAAECIVNKSHRLATEAEIDAYLKAEEKRGREYAEIEARRLMLNPAYSRFSPQQQPIQTFTKKGKE